MQDIRAQQLVFLDRLHTGPFSSPDIEKIFAYGAPVGATIEHHPRLERCMGRLQELVQEEEEQGRVLGAGTIVLADTLSHSSGRFDRVWHAPEGGLWLAMVWPDILLPEFTRLLPFAIGVACCRTIRQFGVDARLKWVNDVHIGRKKLAGILCSTMRSLGYDRYHLIGIGMNGNNQIFPEELQGKATSLRAELSRKIDLTALTGCLLTELQWALGLLHYDEEQALAEGLDCEQGRESLLLAVWRDLCDTAGRRVEYGFDIEKKAMYRALAREIDPCGGLVMELEDGGTVTEYSGEIVYL
ncbi:MAG: biotin--[acetyl-CoA-carboxylase] ligase [Candidatus Electrothrix scaldis]|nr:MAG: biotin--[acetyl-CoA-carboxylase] ligase [Candidatus Electrothrix sp. GW3-3]